MADPHQIWLDDLYTSSSQSDGDALAAFATAFAAGTYGDCVLNFSPGKGHGANGRYFVDREIQFSLPAATQYRLELNFGESIVRYTQAASKFRYTALGNNNQNTVTPAPFFAMIGGVHQYANTVDCIGWWDMPYQSSRPTSTGYARDMRISPFNASSGCTLNTAFRLKNTWLFEARRIEHLATGATPGTILANSSLIEQQGLCVDTLVDHTTSTGADQAIRPGFATLLAVNGSFGSGSYARGYSLRQSSSGAFGYFGRNDSVHAGYVYSLYDVTGTFANGQADLLDYTGNVVGSFNVTGTQTYTQNSETITVTAGSAFVNCNYGIYWTNPDPSGNRFTNITFSDTHVGAFKTGIRLDGASNLTLGSGLNVQTGNPNYIAIDLANVNEFVIEGCTSTTNGATGGIFLRLRNAANGTVLGNSMVFFATPIDTDGTVTHTIVSGNEGWMGGAIANTGTRYNATHPEGITFRGNGAIGAGVDIDDNRRLNWSPVVSSQNGTIAAYTASGSYVLANGMLTASARIQVTNRGSADGAMQIALPITPSQPVVRAVAQVLNTYDAEVLYAPLANNLIAVSQAGTRQSAFKSSAGAFGNYEYLVSFSLPVEVN
jgi:hypothetical protein